MNRANPLIDGRSTVDKYVRENQIALEVFADRGQSEFHGVSPRTLSAFARRGLVWYGDEHRGGLTGKGRDVLAALEAETADQEDAQ
ncbi:hypothetical protein [Agromyces humi]|uniref:hypothetical protein n=1 Tax=Agromyces humi TaxID=1766800 RepID=UPI001359EB83|nr:hypothetical protein [Agromyces humi]